VSLSRQDLVALRLTCEEVGTTISFLDSVAGPSMSMTCTVRTLEFVETRRGVDQALVMFSKVLDSSLIFSRPCMEAAISSGPRSKPLELTIQPLLLSLDLPAINEWVEFVASLPLPSMNRDASVTALACRVTMSSVDVLLRGDPLVPDSYWNELRLALRLDLKSVSWRVLLEKEAHSHQLLSNCQGGLHLQFRDLLLRVETETDRSAFSLEMQYVALGVFIQTSTRTMESIIVTAGDDHADCRSVSLRVGALSNEPKTSEKDFKVNHQDRGVIEDLGPQSPVVDGSKSVCIHSTQLRFGECWSCPCC
jgi:hypothetical protein